MRHHFNAECFSAQPGLVPWGHAEMFAFKNLPPVSFDAFQPECSVSLGTIIGVTLSFSAKYNVSRIGKWCACVCVSAPGTLRPRDSPSH